MPKPEAKTRQELIDPAITKAGWNLMDRTQVGFEIPVDGVDADPWNGVTLAAYSIARFPVTVAEDACFVAAQAHPQPEKWAIQLQKLDHPVTWVSWDDAVVYAA